ncbi:hypothetical protein EJ571_08955 [Mycobacteroides franklinii]|uniref:Uncharacterized protein n=1 Tax=Mycobacteroides franklinii TaxID=948102 RepID=A0A4R5PBD4_9MYCO|nr:hypothetical protein BST24_24330 [Mycobacteroides franklinii]TDH22073.1 hypothetical protein EJ571_08955 [Mycobacteroides franklinii]
MLKKQDGDTLNGGPTCIEAAPRSELVGLVGGRVILARIPVRIPFGRRWRTTGFSMHRWLPPSPETSTSCPSGTSNEELP